MPLPPDSDAASPAPIVIDALDPETMALRCTVAKIAQALDDQNVRWCLVGDLMVALFAIEAGQISRPTADIDILGDARQRPSATEEITRRLNELGATATRSAALSQRRASASPSTARSSTCSPPTASVARR